MIFCHVLKKVHLFWSVDEHNKALVKPLIIVLNVFFKILHLIYFHHYKCVNTNIFKYVTYEF